MVARSLDVSESDLHFVDEHFLFKREVLPISAPSDSWYHDIKFFLLHGNDPEHLDSRRKRALRLISAPYQLIDNILFKKNFEGVLLRCLERNEADSVLPQLHAGPAGGHFGGKNTTHKILKAGYYWPNLFKDAYSFARKCQECQRAGARLKKAALPLHPVIIEVPFQQWGLDIVGPITPASSQ